MRLLVVGEHIQMRCGCIPLLIGWLVGSLIQSYRGMWGTYLGDIGEIYGHLQPIRESKRNSFTS